MIRFPTDTIQTNTFQFDPENILFISNGYCGSACAMFSLGIKAFGLGKLLTIGGLVDEISGQPQPQSFSSYPGGFEVKASQLQSRFSSWYVRVYTCFTHIDFVSVFSVLNVAG